MVKFLILTDLNQCITMLICLYFLHHEGFPRVLYEAMASALPIFTTFVGGISGRMKNLDNCIEIPSKNGTASAEIIYKYINDKKTLKLIGEAAQKKLKIL